MSAKIESTKRCPRCRKRKPLDDFHRSRRTRDGRQAYCKQCRAERSPTRTSRNPLPSDPVACRVCQRPFWIITGKHLRLHGMTLADYRQRFPDAPTIAESYRAGRKEEPGRPFVMTIPPGAPEHNHRQLMTMLMRDAEGSERHLRDERKRARRMIAEGFAVTYDDDVRGAMIALFKGDTTRRRRQPNQRDWNHSPTRPSISLIVRLFGSWNALVIAAGGTPQPNDGSHGRTGKPKRLCSKGHRIATLPNGQRYCPVCKRDAAKLWMRRKRASDRMSSSETREADR